MVRQHMRILDILLFQSVRGLLEEIGIDPTWHRPVLFWDQLVIALRFCRGARDTLELLRERDLVEEGPRIVELVVPRPFQITHRLYDACKLLVTDKG